MQRRGFAEQDRLLFGSRWVLLLLIYGVLLLFRNQIETFNASSFAVAFVISATFNAGLYPFLAMEALKRAAPAAILFCDLMLAAVFAWLSGGNGFIVAGGGGALMVASLLRPHVRWNAAQVIGIATVMASPLVLPTSAGNGSALLTLVPIGLATIIASYAYDKEMGRLRRRMEQLDGAQEAYVADNRQRTRAIAELTYIMSATLNYQKVLDAMLEAGRLGLRMPEREQSKLFAGVFLFHVDDSRLHVVSSRRFTRADDVRTLSGTEGIAGRALREAVPVFGTDATEDSELQNFVAFQGCKSLLCIPLRAGFDNFGVLLFGSDTANAFTEDHGELLTALGIQATLALQNAILYHNLIQEKERIVDLDEEARKKLARDLHDGPTQSIAAIAMRMSYIQKLFKKSPQQVPDEIKKVEDLARRTTTEIRHMLFTLRPLVLESQGMSAALNQLADKMYEMYGQAVAVRVERGVEDRLDYQQQGVIFFIVEEAVNNARKHANAKLVSISAMQQNDMAIVQIADNGVGFDLEKMEAGYESRANASLGMVNMRERAELLDGTLSMQSAVGKGTTITVVLPLQSPEKVTSTNRLNSPKTKLALAAAARVERADIRDPYL